MDRNIQSVDYFKDILRQALSVIDHLNIKTKKEILEFKTKLEEYTNLIDAYVVRPPDISSDQVWEEGLENETQMGFLREDLDRIGTEILKAVAIIKNAGK
jgi:hypothetical protein